MTPTALAAAIAAANKLILDACPVYDLVTGAQTDMSHQLSYILHMQTQAIGYGATPAQVAASVIRAIKSWPSNATPSGESWGRGWVYIQSEGYTTFDVQFAPPGTGVHNSPSDIAKRKADALATANVSEAERGKPFRGLDGQDHDQYSVDYKDARAALLAAASGAPVPVPVSAPPSTPSSYAGPERRIKQNRIADRRVAAKAPVTTGGGTISPGHGIA